jgi:heptaprenyl diphosphate synthase
MLARPLSEEEASEVLLTLREHDALKDARKQLHEFAREAKDFLAPLPQISTKKALENLCEALVLRTA